MKKANVEISAIIELSYDENLEEFKEALESYRKCIDSSATKYDMLKQIAWYVSCFGIEKMIEGIGYVSVCGVKQGDPDTWCGVDIDKDSFNLNGFPEYETEIV